MQTWKVGVGLLRGLPCPGSIVFFERFWERKGTVSIPPTALVNSAAVVQKHER